MNNWPRLKAYLESLPACRDRDALLNMASGKCLLKRSRPVTAMQRQEKRESLPSLKKELDRVFSLFIRQRDSGPDGIAKCSTCDYRARWQEMDAGHYVPRQDMNTRYDEKNVHIQCKSENAFRGGVPEKMAVYIDKKYGAGTAEILRAKGKIKTRIDRNKFKIWIKYYRERIKE